MKERPIIFSGPMVRAILAGRKTQTRRIVKPQPPARIEGQRQHRMAFTSDDEGTELFVYSQSANAGGWNARCPYGQPGDRLWVRERWRVGAWDTDTGSVAIDYCADNSCRKEWIEVPEDNEDMFQRLWEQSSDDAERTGTKYDADGEYHWKPGESPCRWRPSIHMPRWASRIALEVTNIRVERAQDISEGDVDAEGVGVLEQVRGILRDDWKHTDSFQRLWDSVNAARGFGWDTNPWVWVVEFKKIP